jgi:hypothetical protein
LWTAPRSKFSLPRREIIGISCHAPQATLGGRLGICGVDPLLLPRGSIAVEHRLKFADRGGDLRDLLIGV